MGCLALRAEGQRHVVLRLLSLLDHDLGRGRRDELLLLPLDSEADAECVGAGRHVADIAVLYPIDDMEARYGITVTVQASDKLLAAIKTIIVADFVMSLDNVIAIAGAAEQADPSQRTGLIIFGLLVSVPFIVFGSQIILKLLDRFPIIVLLGGALLGWIAGGLIVTDPVAVPYIPQTDMVRYVASAAGALVVIAVAKILAARRSPAHGA